MSSPTTTKILILGSTGNIGKKAALSFAQNKHFEAYVLQRKDADQEKQKKISELKQHGVKVIEGDPSDSKVYQGIDVVLSCVSGQGFFEQIKAIDAAKLAGVKTFIPSEFGIDIRKSEVPLFEPKKAVRKHLESSGLSWIYVVTDFFLDGTFGPHFGMDLQNGKVEVLGDGNGKVSLTLTDEIGSVLPEIVLNPKSKNSTVFISGSTVTWNQAIEFFEKKYGKTFEKKTVSVEELKKQINSDPNPWNTVLTQLKLVLALGHGCAGQNQISDYTKIHLTTFEEFFSKK